MTPLRSLILLTLLSATPLFANELVLEVNLEESTLTVRDAGGLEKQFEVATGTEAHPTPRGRFLIRKLIWNPGWVPPDAKWARKKTPKNPGHPDNPMKAVKIFFKEPDYYIHGSDDPRSPSHGCIRMSPEDATEVGRLVMEYGGQSKPLPWYRRVFQRRSSRAVVLTEPVAMVVSD